ncbi:MAG: glycoside hydrolase family 13 protein [Eubacteriales bacterium]|nr:glycoside hydrolase family 13 protein [Eubacteriales bacterium]
MTERQYRVAYYENGKKTEKLVKYTGRAFSVCTEGHGLTSACLKIYDDDGFVAEAAGVKNGETHVFVFPELERGCYRFHIEAASSAGQFTSEPQRMLVVNNIYNTITPPNGIIYQIFPDRFAKGGTVPVRRDVVINDDWYGEITQYPENPGDYVENNEFFGGTLYGITAKLDYLSGMSCKWIYLNPIFTAYSNHKYDTGDFLSTDAMFGGEAALERLIAECHNRGMKLILDGVFNHVGRDSVYFDYKGINAGAYHNLNSPYREWFDIRDDGGYDCWWGITNLPKIKKTKSYRRFICDTVIPKYMKMGIDGWRLDVVDEYDNAFLEEITASAKRIDPNAVIIGEVWDDVTDKVAYSERKSYFYGAALDSATNYPLRDALIKYIKSGDAVYLKEELDNQINHYPEEKLDCMMNILGTHDTERILTVLGGDDNGNKTGKELADLRLTPQQREKGKKLLMAAYALLACLPGIPAVYYGDEAGLEGGRDPFNRKPFPWGREDGELVGYYRKINAIRANSQTLIKGKTKILQWNDGFFAFERECGSDICGGKIFCVCNMSANHVYYTDGSYIPLNLRDNKVYPGETGIYGVC